VSLQRAASDAFKHSVSAEMAARRLEGNPDLLSIVPGVEQPALVLERRAGPLRRFAMQVAERLPRGELRLVSGFGPTAYPDHDEIVEATFEFLGIKAGPEGPPQEQASGTAIILFADIVDSTALSEQLGNAAFRERSTMLEARIRDAVREHGGESVAGRTLGDGVLATFPSAAQGIAAALTCAEAGADLGLALHLGLHAGDVLREDRNVHGIAVSLASRVSDLSAPNEVLVSATVRDLARASAGVSFEDRGERELKGIAEPQRLFAVSQNEQ
jgi:class 3 adenylate cyclase